MPINEIDAMMMTLSNLNTRIGDMEQRQGEEAYKFFYNVLSDQLIFRRADGTVISKSGENGFMNNLSKPSPFAFRVSEDISVTLLDNRALVTLIVVGTRTDGSAGRYRNIRMFSQSGDKWILDLWYNYEIGI